MNSWFQFRFTWWLRSVLAFGLMAAMVGGLVGCRPKTQSGRTRQTNPGLQRRSDQGQALLDSAISQLANLPSYVELELTPPQVILDSRSSSDGQDVMATLSPPPGKQDGPRFNNFLNVRTGNSRFRGLGVRSGDMVKYYVAVDASALATEGDHFRTGGASDSDSEDDATADWNEGFVREAAVELMIAQVVDDNSLILAQPLVVPITEPKRIEVWRYSDDRMLEFRRRLGRYSNRGIPKLAWEPSPDERVMLQILDRLNPWSRQNHPEGDWKIDPLLESLGEDLRNNELLQPYISDKALARMSFDLQDVRILQQAIWHRDVSEWSRGERFDNLERASSLFDWTVRNVQLDADDEYVPRWPWQTLLAGHGTAQQRAWIFSLLCRQQQIDVVALSTTTSSGESEFWLPAVLHEGELYLFDTRLGLPIPGLDQQSDHQTIATLSQISTNPELLEALDIEDYSYPVSADTLNGLSANIIASPAELTRRSALFEKEFKGDNRLFLTAPTEEIEKALGNQANVANVRLWDFPFITLLDQLSLPQKKREAEAAAFQPFAWRPSLYKARMLHFQGKKEIKKNLKRGGLEEEINSHRDAIKLYTGRRVRPPERKLQGVSSPEKRDIYTSAKTQASYWLGLISYDDGRYDAAIDWLEKRTLAPYPGCNWAQGARYNLARSYEALGEFDKANSILTSAESPQRHGNLLRARQLSTSSGSESETESTATTEVED